MTDLGITENSKFKFYKLKFSNLLNDAGTYTVVRWQTDESISANKEAVVVIKSLMSGNSIEETADYTGLGKSNVMYIVKLCIDVGFVSEIDGKPIPDKYEKIKPWLINVDRKWFMWSISKPLLLLMYIYIFSGFILGISNRRFIPDYNDLFWTDDLLLMLVSFSVIGLIGFILHEGAHFIVTKAVGGEARIRLDARFLDLVVETIHYHMSVIPKGKKYLVYLAGIFVDSISISSIFWIYFLRCRRKYNIMNLTLC